MMVSGTRCYQLVVHYSADEGKKREGKGCAVFLLCAVLLLYASCDPNMYCILQKKKEKKKLMSVQGRERNASPLTRSHRGAC